MAVLLLGQSSSPFRTASHSPGGPARTVTPSHLPLGDRRTSRQHPGFASHANDVSSQPWLQQGAAALPSTDDGQLTAAALPADAACDDATLTGVQACTSCIESLPDTAQDLKALASHAATAL